MNYLFLDESGNMGLKNTNFMIITIVSFSSLDEVLKIKKIRNRICHHKKFKKELKIHNEIKFYKYSKEFKQVLLNKTTEIDLLNKTTEIDFKSYSIVMNKKNFENIKLLKNYNKNEIYIDMVITLLNNMNLNSQCYLRLDKSLPRKYIEKLDSKIKNNSNDYISKYEIFHSNSNKYLGLQFADIISGTCF